MASHALFAPIKRAKNNDVPQVPLHIIIEDRKRREQERERRRPQLPLYDECPGMSPREEEPEKRDGERRGVVIIELWAKKPKDRE